MITFRSELIDIERLTFLFVSSNDPDLIGVEVMLDGNVLVDMSMDQEGQTSILFDADGGVMEFDLPGLRSVLDKCEAELLTWRERLRAPGGIWTRE